MQKLLFNAKLIHISYGFTKFEVLHVSFHTVIEGIGTIDIRV